MLTILAAKGYAQEPSPVDTTSVFSEDMRVGICMKKFL